MAQGNEKLGPLEPEFIATTGGFIRKHLSDTQRRCVEQFFKELRDGQINNPHRTIDDKIYVAACGHIIKMINGGKLVVEIIPGFMR